MFEEGGTQKSYHGHFVSATLNPGGARVGSILLQQVFEEEKTPTSTGVFFVFFLLFFFLSSFLVFWCRNRPAEVEVAKNNGD